MRRGLIVLVVALAGCTSGGEGGDDASPPVSAEFVDAQTSDELGAVQGTVLGNDLLPIVGAHVVLHEVRSEAEARETTANEDGLFQFSLLPPGTYMVMAGLDGYSDASTLVQVAAGAVAQTTLTLSEAPTDQAYAIVNVQAGIIGCGMAAIVESFSCYTSAAGQAFGEDVFNILYDIPANHHATVVETDWAQTSQTLHNWFWGPYNETLLVQPWLGDSVGTPVLRGELLPDQQAPSVRPFPGEHARFPRSDQSLVLQVQTFYDGRLQKEADAAAHAACATSPRLGYCSGVGVALEFRFTQYLTVFVGEAPPDLAAFTAAPDA